MEDPAIWDELVDFGKEHPTVGPSRRLLFDLTAEENQVYLFMVRRRTLHEPNLPSSNPTLRDIHDCLQTSEPASLDHPPNHQVIFGAILFATPPFLKCLQIIKKMRGLKAVTDTDLEMWDFAEEYEDMKHIHDPLDGEQRDNKKKKKRRG